MAFRLKPVEMTPGWREKKRTPLSFSTSARCLACKKKGRRRGGKREKREWREKREKREKKETRTYFADDGTEASVGVL